MRSLLNLRIGTRLGLAFAITLLLMAALGAISYGALGHVEEQLADIVEDNGKKLLLLQDMSESVHITQRVVRTVVLLDDVAQQDRELKKVADARHKYEVSWDELSKMPASDKAKVLRAHIDAAKVAGREATNKVTSSWRR